MKYSIILKPKIHALLIYIYDDRTSIYDIVKGKLIYDEIPIDLDMPFIVTSNAKYIEDHGEFRSIDIPIRELLIYSFGKNIRINKSIILARINKIGSSISLGKDISMRVNFSNNNNNLANLQISNAGYFYCDVDSTKVMTNKELLKIIKGISEAKIEARNK